MCRVYLCSLCLFSAQVTIEQEDFCDFSKRYSFKATVFKNLIIIVPSNPPILSACHQPQTQSWMELEIELGKVIFTSGLSSSELCSSLLTWIGSDLCLLAPQRKGLAQTSACWPHREKRMLSSLHCDHTKSKSSVVF